MLRLRPRRVRMRGRVRRRCFLRQVTTAQHRKRTLLEVIERGVYRYGILNAIAGAGAAASAEAEAGATIRTTVRSGSIVNVNRSIAQPQVDPRWHRAAGCPLRCAAGCPLRCAAGCPLRCAGGGAVGGPAHACASGGQVNPHSGHDLARGRRRRSSSLAPGGRTSPRGGGGGGGGGGFESVGAGSRAWRRRLRHEEAMDKASEEGGIRRLGRWRGRRRRRRTGQTRGRRGGWRASW